MFMIAMEMTQTTSGPQYLRYSIQRMYLLVERLAYLLMMLKATSRTMKDMPIANSRHCSGGGWVRVG